MTVGRPRAYFATGVEANSGVNGEALDRHRRRDPSADSRATDNFLGQSVAQLHRDAVFQFLHFSQ